MDVSETYPSKDAFPVACPVNRPKAGAEPQKRYTHWVRHFLRTFFGDSKKSPSAKPKLETLCLWRQTIFLIRETSGGSWFWVERVPNLTKSSRKPQNSSGTFARGGSPCAKRADCFLVDGFKGKPRPKTKVTKRGPRQDDISTPGWNSQEKIRNLSRTAQPPQPLRTTQRSLSGQRPKADAAACERPPRVSNGMDPKRGLLKSLSLLFTSFGREIGSVAGERLT